MRNIKKMNDLFKKILRRHYLSLEGYVSAGMEMEKTESKVFMNANENPYALRGLEGFNRYPKPQPSELLEVYASLYACHPEQIVATRGADEAISVLSTLLCEPHKDSIVIAPPAFGMYAVNAAGVPAHVLKVPLIRTNSGTFALDEDALIETASNPENSTKIVYLCSPNNPTGTSFSPESIMRVCDGLRDVCAVILDETYIEFAEAESFVAKLDRYPNLIILRTLSKSYALAGMRMGVMICGDTDFVSLVRAKGLDAYPLTVASVDAALKVMTPKMQNLAKSNIKRLIRGRAKLEKAFGASEHVQHVYPSDANFILVKMRDAKGFLKYCAQQDIILRDFSDKRLTEGCIRISVGLPEENDRVIKCLKDF